MQPADAQVSAAHPTGDTQNPLSTQIPPSREALLAKAKESALRKLAAGPASREQVRQMLEGRGHAPDIADEVVTRFVDVGLIDDEEYARIAVRSKAGRQAKARPAIRRDLQQAGVETPIIDDALNAVTDDDEHAAAEAYVAKKLPALLRHDREVIIRRLMGQLARRGYSHQVSWTVIETALAEATHP